MNSSPAEQFAHIERLSDERGLFEHADGLIRREDHGYCTDDNARLLVVAARDTTSVPARQLSRLALRFVLDAQSPDGRCHNRMERGGRWTDRPSTEDCWGRSVWGLGVAATVHSDTAMRRRALVAFDRAIRQRSRWSRAMAFAALGAADVVAADPHHSGAVALLADALDTIGRPPEGPWMWPEPRLRYANATLAEAVIAASHGLDRPDDLAHGLRMLQWLLELETPNGHLSVVGVGGRGPGDIGPMFDQQAIEVSAMADACWRAATVTGDRAWLRGVTTAADWFAGANDLGLPMFDPVSGGGYDGLHRDRVNLNQGAESTLAWISTRQRARSLMVIA